MLGRRLLALAVAAVLIGGALVARSRLDGDGGTADVSESGDLRLACIAELASVCSALATAKPSVKVTIEAAGTTIDRLGTPGQPVDVDAWVTFAPLPESVADARGETVFADRNPLAVSALGIAVRADRQSVLAARCPGLAWKCAGDLAGRSWSQIGGRQEWGTVKPGFENPGTSARGLMTFTNAVVSWFGDPDVSRRDFADGSFRTWLKAIRDTNPTDTGALDSSLVRMITQPGSLDLVGTTQADWAALGSRADFPFVAATGADAANVKVVLATTSGRNAAKLADVVHDELVHRLAAAGWTTVANAADPATDGTTVNAIRNLWREQ